MEFRGNGGSGNHYEEINIGTIDKVHINGRVIRNVRGSITIINGKLLVNGKSVEEYDEAVKDENDTVLLSATSTTNKVMEKV